MFSLCVSQIERKQCTQNPSTQKMIRSKQKKCKSPFLQFCTSIYIWRVYFKFTVHYDALQNFGIIYLVSDLEDRVFYMESFSSELRCSLMSAFVVLPQVAVQFLRKHLVSTIHLSTILGSFQVSYTFLKCLIIYMPLSSSLLKLQQDHRRLDLQTSHNLTLILVSHQSS